MVIRKISQTTCEKIRQNIGLISFQDFDRAFYEFAEVVRKNFGRKTYRNPFHTLCKQKRKLNRQCNGFSFSSIIGKLPLRRLRIEDYFQRKLGKPGFNVSSRCCTVTGTHITPIALGLDEKVFLT